MSLARYVPRLSAEWEIDTLKPWREVDGTLCYVDISGFTALSEKLARRGRIGAEELTDVLNRVFAEMLQIAYDRGGSLLKFGGDALLLLYRSSDHAEQACSAAVEMQDALRKAKSVRTSVGRLNLRMSVGIHSGTIHLFRVGDSHRELILTGPGASMTTEMEETATAGEILISSATRDLLPRGSAPTPKEEGWLLRWRKARLECCGWSPRMELDPDAIAAGMPVALRNFLKYGKAEPEHRIATVGFIKYTGVDDVMHREGPDGVAAALDHLIRAVQSAADAEGVTFLATDIDQDGGKIILVTGVPGSQVDDEGRMLRAVRRVADRGGVLPLKIGVNQGHVFAGEIGTAFRATYTIMGDTVNLAARLMAAAPPGSIYATPATLDQSGTLFETTALEPFYVKGKTQPVQGYAVGQELGTRRPEEHNELPFVGRRDELRVLISAIDRLHAGEGAAITVFGETGSGKTRLVAEALRACGGAHVVHVRAEPYAVASPYRPLHEMLRSVLGIERSTPEKMAEQLTAAVGELSPGLLPMLPLIADVAMVEVESTPEAEAIDPKFRQERTADAVVEVLGAALPGEVVFEIDDGHWMDGASARLLERVVAATAERPWLVLTTRREERGGFLPDTASVRLGPLDDDDARKLIITATEAAPLRPHEIDGIVRRAGGLPLFLVEIIRAVREAGSAASLPDSLDAVVSAQIDALEPLARRLLRYASVLGRSFRTDELNQLIADEAVSLDAATRRQVSGFLESDGAGRLRFRHALFRDAAYEGLSFKRRHELHLRAGELAERMAGSDVDAAADVLALHFFLGQAYEKAWHYSRIAGDQARDTYANVDAAAHYQRALDAVRRLPDAGEDDRAAVLTSLGDVRERAGLFEEALDAYRRASHLVKDDPPRMVDLLLRRALVRRRSGAYGSALRETTAGMKLLDGDRSPEALRSRARLAAERGAISRWQQRPHKALAYAERAEEDARAAGDLESLGRSLDLIDWAYRMMGQTDRAVHYPEALRIFEELGDLSGVAQVWNNLGADAYWEGRWDDAIEAYRKSQEAEFRTGNDVQAAISAANTAELYINQGLLDDAEPLLIEAIRVLRASNHAPAATFAESEMARLLIRRGDYEEAEQLLDQIKERAVAAGEGMNVLNVAIQRADSKLRQGQAALSLQILGEAVADAGDIVELFAPTIARLRACGLAALGRVDEALSEVDTGLDKARKQGLLYDQAMLLDARNEIAIRAGLEAGPEDLAEADRLLGVMHIRREPVLSA